MEMNYVDPSSIMLRETGAGSDQHYVRIVNPPTHPGGMRTPMPQFYALQDQRVIERVPRPLLLSPPYESVSAILFSANGYPGVRMRDILKEKVIIDAPNDFVFEELGFRSILASLEWPGYDAVHSRIDVRPGGTCITRQHLAWDICRLMLKFHQNISRYPIAPGSEKWALTAGPEGIRVTDIVLFSLHYYRNIWVPELYVIE